MSSAAVMSERSGHLVGSALLSPPGLWTHNATTGAEARFIQYALRGAEQPLFPGTSRICKLLHAVSFCTRLSFLHAVWKLPQAVARSSGRRIFTSILLRSRLFPLKFFAVRRRACRG